MVTNSLDYVFVVDLRDTVAKEKPLEDVFEDSLKEAGIKGYERNVRFVPSRRFKADFWFEKLLLAVEVDGGIFMKNRTGHTSGKGYHSDRVRDQLALSHGITTVRFTTPQVRSGEGVEYLKAYLPHRAKEVKLLSKLPHFRQDLPVAYGESTSGKKRKSGGK